ncbi:MAG: DNA polymerase III subunit delta [Defluviitaleaceae bacterium]|nr:DNA polymerase III subunit delta [Defluviitaleaceae bacterium]
MIQSFDTIKGNELIIKSMQAAIEYNRIGHAYIIDGAAGSGKHLLASTFSAAILCENLVGNNPCGACISCITLISGNHPDVTYVQATKKSLGIDDVREQITENISILPYSSQKRMYIIKNAHTLTIPAQNALLKTLEDGPKYAVFFLLSQDHKAFLPTIMSRCALYKIAPLGDSVVSNHLVSQGIDANLAAIAAASSSGSIGRAMTIATDESFTPFRNEILDIAQGIAQKDITDIFAAAKTMENHKERITEALDIMCMYYRDVLVGEQTDYPQAIIRKIRNIEKAKQKLNANCNFLLTMEVMLLKLAEAA